ncbi:MAG: tRNA (guanosine(37)-N1)-methyltransferase TrmD [Lachnospiraceae bacterium]|nr:tRNA (guanosine(37)-N1)-methyltransferase TrmD [Lachnospiraceae bacterium]
MIRFDVLTLFPDMFSAVLGDSIIKRAADKGLIEMNFINIRDFSENKHKKTDDYPYSGGGGMLMTPQPIYDAYQSIAKGLDYKPYTIYMSPCGRVFDQKTAVELSGYKHIVILCGHYEGIDERALQELDAEFISVGDYVLTGGELPAMILVDAVSRLVPGVLHNDTSAETESFESGILEYPQYSRPEVWEKEAVPKVLLSGDHKKVDEWRRVQAILRTYERRPDLLSNLHFKKADLKLLKRVEMSEKEKKILKKLLQEHMDSDKISTL